MPLPPPPVSTRMSSGVVVLLLAMMLGLQPVTTDLYLPALPSLTDVLGASVSQAQLTLSALLLAFGASQLVWGPLSDRFGRRPVLLLGTGSFVLASLASALAPSIEWLIAGRVVQGAAMGAVVMAARAIVRDLYAPADGARVMSKALTGLGVIACLSAPVGGLLAQFLGWRATMLALAVFGATLLALVVMRLRETAPQFNPQALQAGTLVSTWAGIARHPTFLAYSALAVCTYAGLFTFLAASSFVFIEVLGLSKVAYGLVMLVNSLAYIVGTLLCRRLLLRLGVQGSVALAGGLSLAGGVSLYALAQLGEGSSWYGAWAVVVPMVLFMLGHGVHQPCSQSGAVGPFPQAAGAASALNGFLMMVMAFAVGQWLGAHLDGTVFPLAKGMLLWSVCIAAVAWTLVRWHGAPASR